MKSDVLVLGNELDGLVAALRLLRAGRSVRLLARGMGSLHYAPGGLHVLGYLDGEAAPTAAPLESVARLPAQHPYGLVGRAALAAALDWVQAEGPALGLDFCNGETNRPGLSASGRSVPVLSPYAAQALDELPSGPVVLVRFRGHREFPAALLLAALKQGQVRVRLVDAEPPPGSTDNSGIARGFDRLAAPEDYFRALAAAFGETPSLVLFPAVLGLTRHAALLRAAEAALGCPCREVPTLPPSIPGQRLSTVLLSAIRAAGGTVQLGSSAVTGQLDGEGCGQVTDRDQRRYEASVFILATGGVLMGGLEVAADGSVREPVFGLPVRQTQPLEQTPRATLSALHRTGIEADFSLRPLSHAQRFDNVLVTGRTLAHWDPVAEVSAEGVALATGWAAAGSALALLDS